MIDGDQRAVVFSRGGFQADATERHWILGVGVFAEAIEPTVGIVDSQHVEALIGEKVEEFGAMAHHPDDKFILFFGGVCF